MSMGRVCMVRKEVNSMGFFERWCDMEFLEMGDGWVIDGYCEICGVEKEVLISDKSEVEGICRDCWLELCERMKDGVM